MTQSHDCSRTSLHGGAWDPSSANILARSEVEFDYSLDVPTPSLIGVSNLIQTFHTGTTYRVSQKKVIQVWHVIVR